MLDGAQGERPAQAKDATSSAKSTPQLKLRSGGLTVTLFSTIHANGEMSYFVIPERSYRNAKQEWETTHLLHVEDLLPMSLMLQRVFNELRVHPDDVVSKKSK